MVHETDTSGADVITIATLDDPRVADYRLLADPPAIERAGLFVVEGRLNVRRLFSLPHYRTRSVLVTPAAWAAFDPGGVTVAGASGEPDREFSRLRDGESNQQPASAIAGPQETVPVYVISQTLMNAIAGFNIHRGCVALAERPAAVLVGELALDAARRLVLLEGVNNPDNVGGIFRSAAAFGVDAVVLGPQAGDPLYRKAIRTSMGATLQVPFAFAGAWPDAITTLRAQGWQVVALTPSADAESLDTVPRDLPRVAVMVGAEGDGLTADAMSRADRRVTIPMSRTADSLNVTVAASIALHHFHKAALAPRAP